MGFWADIELSEEHRAELLREAADQRLARLAREGRAEAQRVGPGGDGGIEVRWGLDADEGRVAELLELNGMPRWAAFEERFAVAERDGKVLAALSYRTEPKRLVLELLVVEPWAGEQELAVALYAGAGELARELGAREVLVPAGGRDYPGEAGYRWRLRGWRLDVARSVERRGELPARGWRRAVSLLGVVATPFFRPFVR